MKHSWAIAVLGVGFVIGGVLRADAAGSATPIKVGYIDLQRTLQETSAGKKAKKKLESDKTKKQDELKKKEKELTDYAAELDKQRAVLKPDVLRQREQELQEKYVALQDRYFQLQQDLSKQEASLVQEIFGKAAPVIEQIAKHDGYTMIVEKNEGAVLYAADGLDITSEVDAAMK